MDNFNATLNEASSVMFSIVIILLSVMAAVKLIQKLTIGRDNSYSCLVGKTAVITGGNSGIGFQTALKLASRGCRVIIGDIVNPEKSVQNIIDITNNPNVVGKQFDLASFASVRKFAEDIIRNEKRLDILINNAGCVGFEGIYTEDGILKWLQVNYLGPFLLTHLLVDLIKKTQGSRIVFVGSLVAFLYFNLSVPHLNQEPTTFNIKSLHSTVNYIKSKICVIIAVCSFSEKLKKYGIICTVVHPGAVDTEIYAKGIRNTSVSDGFVPLIRFIVSISQAIYFKTPAEGAETTVYCATSPNVKSGGLYMDCAETWKPPSAYNQNLARDLWKESERLAGLKDDEKLH